MKKDLDTIKEELKEDMLILDSAIEEVKLGNSKITELTKYNENLKSSFDEEVQKTAMRILDASATGMNDGGGSLVYKAA